MFNTRKLETRFISPRWGHCYPVRKCETISTVTSWTLSQWFCALVSRFVDKMLCPNGVLNSINIKYSLLFRYSSERRIKEFYSIVLCGLTVVMKVQIVECFNECVLFRRQFRPVSISYIYENGCRCFHGNSSISSEMKTTQEISKKQCLGYADT